MRVHVFGDPAMLGRAAECAGSDDDESASARRSPITNRSGSWKPLMSPPPESSPPPNATIPSIVLTKLAMTIGRSVRSGIVSAPPYRLFELLRHAEPANVAIGASRRRLRQDVERDPAIGHGVSGMGVVAVIDHRGGRR
jgi:hypothetical protein